MFKFQIVKRLLLAAALSFSVHAVMAQPAAAPASVRQEAPVSGFNPDAVEVHQDDLLANQRLITGRITLPDTRARTLIQPDGRMWRDYQRSVVPWIAAVLVLGTLAALALFYAIKGRIMIDGGRGIATILRFSSFERFMHWLTAASWCVLALSGLNMVAGRFVLLPLLGNDNFSALSRLLKPAHNFVAFPFMLGVLLMFLVWLRANIPNQVDVNWFKSGGGFLDGSHPPAGKFNGGQKMVFWVVVLAGAAMSATGLSLMFPFAVTNIFGMQIIQVIHGGIALLMIAMMLSHIYIGSVGMEGAFDAMNSGDVDLTWAKDHHSLWVAEELAKAEKPQPSAAE